MQSSVELLRRLKEQHDKRTVSVLVVFLELVALINAVRLELVEGAVDLTPFVSRLSYAFLPRLVYQLEEYGLPRMISKQLSKARMFNFEDDEKEISDIIAEFQEAGYERMVAALSNKHPFDEYVLKHFFDGIRVK